MITEFWTCQGCGAEYSVTVMKIGSREKEHHTCDDCGEVLFTGKVAKIYNPKKTKSGQPKKQET